jgi:hypothetical protein
MTTRKLILTAACLTAVLCVTQTASAQSSGKGSNSKKFSGGKGSNGQKFSGGKGSNDHRFDHDFGGHDKKFFHNGHHDQKFFHNTGRHDDRFFHGTGNKFGTGKGGDFGFGVQVGFTGGNRTGGFDAARARELARLIKDLASRAFRDTVQNDFRLNSADQKFFLDGFRVISADADRLLDLLGRRGDVRGEALQLARRIEGLTDRLQERARQINNERLEDVLRGLDRLSDQLVNVID